MRHRSFAHIICFLISFLWVFCMCKCLCLSFCMHPPLLGSFCLFLFYLYFLLKMLVCFLLTGKKESSGLGGGYGSRGESE